MCVVLAQGARISGSPSPKLRGVGQQTIRQTSLQHFLQELHRKSVGDELQRDLGRLGRAAYSRSIAWERDQERALAPTFLERRPHQSYQDVDQFFPISAQRPGDDVGSVRGKSEGNGRESRNGSEGERLRL